MSAEAWGFWEADGVDQLPLTMPMAARLQAEAAHEAIAERAEQDARLARAYVRQDRAMATAMARAQLRGQVVDPMNPTTFSRSVAEVLAEAAEVAEMQDAKTRAREWRERGDVEVLAPTQVQLRQSAPASRSLPLRTKVRLALQRMATGTDERRVRQL
jgi:hypothetical protein